ncbi:hypothetical protein [Paraburkholderia susongensis]|uniref:DUF4105 domain-containing protein n=1 Tax=Paraburkholderia susongensis TaxID=1515439 RepID=A0A1X7IAW6_9BURK|nr:hypothetical protein [Paraburkholderia susongensis]SMG11618.1 hypothetical protein SAMN06265784_101498 [Paraburkholderia susongensis]
MQKCVSRYLTVAVVLVTLCSNHPARAVTTTASTEPDIPAGDMCGPVQNRDVYALIASPGDSTFSVDSSRTEAGKLTCAWSALKAGTQEGSAADATLTLDLYHFANAARARAELRGFNVAPHAPHARTDDPDDEVIQLSPDMMAARHGENVAVARASVPQSISRRSSWNSQFEALTLTGAKAQLLAPPEPPGAASAAASPAAVPDAWRPPERRLPANSAMFVPVVHVIWLLTRWSFELVPVAILSSILICFIAVRLRRLALIWLVPLIVGYAFLNLAFGKSWGVALIDRFGIQAPATITGRFPTNDIYNNQNVVGYHVLIRSLDGAVVETTFRTDDFNVYPSRNATRYPASGDVFTVRYLHGYPDDFVIVSNDGSPWSNRLRCEALAVSAGQADQKVQFAPENPSFQQAAQAAHAALQSAGCQVDDDSN